MFAFKGIVEIVHSNKGALARRSLEFQTLSNFHHFFIAPLVVLEGILISIGNVLHFLLSRDFLLLTLVATKMFGVILRAI